MSRGGRRRCTNLSESCWGDTGGIREENGNDTNILYLCVKSSNLKNEGKRKKKELPPMVH